MNPQSPEKAPVPLSSDRLNKAPFESDCPPSLSYSPQIPFFFLEIIFQNKLLIASTFLNLVSLVTQFKILGTTSSSINRHSRWILELNQLNSDKDPIFVDKWGDLNPWYAAASQLLRFSPAVNWNHEDGRWSIFYESKLIKNKYMVSVHDQECRTGWLWLLVFRRLVKGKETGRQLSTSRNAVKLGMLPRQLRDGPLPAHSRRKMAEIQSQGLIVSTTQLPWRTNTALAISGVSVRTQIRKQ